MLLPLESCEGKLRRAKAHARTLEDQLTRAAETDHHRIVAEHDPDGSQYVFRVRDLVPTDPEWSYIFGDCVQNLRASLDHLAYQLAVLGQSNYPFGPARELTEDEARSTGFIIESDPTKFPAFGQGRLRLLRPGEQIRMRELQPFYANDMSIWRRSPKVVLGDTIFGVTIPHCLADLNLLANIDKHRLVHVAQRYGQGGWTGDIPEPPITVSASWSIEALDENAIVGCWRYAGRRPDLPSDIDLNSHFPIGVSLGDIPLSGPPNASYLLKVLVITVETVVEIFRPCIEHGRPPLPLSGIDSGYTYV